MTDLPGAHRLARRTSREGLGRGVLVPTGAVEQHGPHLPLGTDIYLATAVADAVAQSRPGVRVAEPLPYGCSWHHRGFPGTVSLRPATFISVVVDVCTALAADGALPILCNGHAGNRAALEVAVTELATAGVRAAAITYFEQITDVIQEKIPEPETSVGHACAMETSLIAYLWPDAVRADAVPAGGTPPAWPDPHLFGPDRVTVIRRFEEVNPTGVVGRPEVATTQLGAELFTAAVERCGAVVDRLIADYAA